jgi:hypothetical protein
MYPKWDGNKLQSSLGWEVEPDCSWNVTSIQDARSNTKAAKSVRTRYYFGPKSSVAATLTTLSEASYRARVRQALDELPTIVLLYVCNVRIRCTAVLGLAAVNRSLFLRVAVTTNVPAPPTHTRTLLPSSLPPTPCRACMHHELSGVSVGICVSHLRHVYIHTASIRC